MDVNMHHQLLSCVLEILKKMTESGAEIYRIEESAHKMFEAYGIKNADVYATTSNIIVSLETADGVIKTHTRRIGSISTDIERIHKLNSLVRAVTANKPDPSWIREEISDIDSTPVYSKLLTVIFYGVIAGAFYLFFGGRSIAEIALSSAIGIITGVISTNKLGLNKILVKFICSFIACLIVFALNKFGLVKYADYIFIANIMTLIPGIGLTNALRDLFVGDSISGVLRLIEAAMLAIAIASGYMAASFVFGGVI